MFSKLLFLALAAAAVSGCAALTSTTNTTARAIESGLELTTQGTEATSRTDDNDRYADARAFAASLFRQIRREAAAGGGEHTQALARLLDAPDQHAFDAWLQANYEPLFADIDHHADLVTRINARRPKFTHNGSNDNDA